MLLIYKPCHKPLKIWNFMTPISLWPTIQTLISSFFGKKKNKLLPALFYFAVGSSDDGQTPQSCLLNMNESCGDRIAKPSDKLSVFLRQASGLYGHCVKMHLNQNARLTFPHLSITSSIRILPIFSPPPGFIWAWSFLTFTFTLCTTVLQPLKHWLLKIFLSYSFVFSRMTVLLYYFETGSVIDTHSKLEVHLLPFSSPLCLFPNQLEDLLHDHLLSWNQEGPFGLPLATPCGANSCSPERNSELASNSLRSQWRSFHLLQPLFKYSSWNGNSSLFFQLLKFVP